jgi:lipopolysaccharide transport system permease protein
MFVDTQLDSAVEFPSKPSLADDSAGSAGPTEILIRSTGGWQFVDVQELWRCRELIFFLAWRDVKVRYKQAALGAAWAVLQPAMMMVVFTIFFSRMAGLSSGRWPYPLFVYSGLLPWTFFATAIAGAGNSVVASERLITKVYFPRMAIPFAAVGAAVVDFIIALGLLAVMMLWYRVRPGVGLLMVPLIFGGIALAGLGIGTMLAALNVAYRDFRYVIPFLIQLGLFATPTVYTQPEEARVAPKDAALATADRVTAATPPPVRAEGRPVGPPGRLGLGESLLVLNPMTALIAAFRAAILGGPIPWGRLGVDSVYAAALFVSGCLYFRMVEDRFGDII